MKIIIEKEWYKLTKEDIYKYIESIFKYCKLIIKAQKDVIKY